MADRRPERDNRTPLERHGLLTIIVFLVVLSIGGYSLWFTGHAHSSSATGRSAPALAR